MEALHFNYRLVLKELQQRGVVCRQIGATEIVECIYNDHKEYLLETCNRLIPSHYIPILNDKILAKTLLANAGIPTAPFISITTTDEEEMVAQIEHTLHYPICIKPPNKSHGYFVHPLIETHEELLSVWRKSFMHQYFPVWLAEQHVYGEDLRIFLMKDEEPIVLKRTPPMIIGNGIDTIRTLVDKENICRMNPRTSCLCDIYLNDPDGMRCLKRQGLSLDSVVETGRKVPLLFVSNVSYGGRCERMIEGVHNDYIQLAQDVFALFPELPYLAIDLLVEKIAQPYVQGNAFVCELCTYPGFSLFLMPSEGPPVDIVARIVDRLYPETKATSNCGVK